MLEHSPAKQEDRNNQKNKRALINIPLLENTTLH